MSLSEEALNDLKKIVKCRETQIELLNAFISKELETLVPSLIAHGYKSIGKTYTIERYLEALGIKRTIVKCDECVTKKLLLQRCLKRIRMDSGVDLSKYNQLFNYKGVEVTNVGKLCENFASFVVALEQFIEETNYQDPHVLLLDRFDQCMDPTNELFPGFLRLQEQSKIKNISIIFVISSDEPKEIVTNPIPHIYFKPYTQDQIVEILQNNQFCFFENKMYDNHIGEDFWKQYSKIIVDSFFAYTGSNMNLLIDICFKLWWSFIRPVIEGRYKPSEFLRIYRENKDLFINDSIINNSLVREYGTLDEDKSSNATNVDDLPNHSKFILIASYLASFNEPKNDLNIFSRIKVKGKKRKSNIAKIRKGELSKDDINTQLLSPNYFDLERLLAIISVIYRNESESLNKSNEDFLNFYDNMSEREIAKKEQEFAKFTLNSNIDLNSQIATLVSLGLLTRTTALDILSSKIRWKCNISWPMVEGIAKEINFPLHNYLFD